MVIFLSSVILALLFLLFIAAKSLMTAQHKIDSMDWEINSTRECMSQLLAQAEAAINSHENFKNNVTLYVGALGEEAISSNASSLFLGNRLQNVLEEPLYRYSDLRVRLARAMKKPGEECFDPRLFLQRS